MSGREDELPIRPGVAAGDAQRHVAWLHDSLAAAGLVVAKKERANRRFGPSTAEALRAFQHHRGVPATGQLDDLTESLLEAAFPTAAFATQLASSDLPHAEELATLLFEHPELDLLEGNVEAQLKDVSVAGGRMDDKLKEQLQTLARVYRISPRFEDVEAMLRSGLDSASAIVGLAEPDFVERHADQLGGEDRATATHRQARRIYAYEKRGTQQDQK